MFYYLWLALASVLLILAFAFIWLILPSVSLFFLASDLLVYTLTQYQLLWQISAKSFSVQHSRLIFSWKRIFGSFFQVLTEKKCKGILTGSHGEWSERRLRVGAESQSALGLTWSFHAAWTHQKSYCGGWLIKSDNVPWTQIVIGFNVVGLAF